MRRYTVFWYDSQLRSCCLREKDIEARAEFATIDGRCPSSVRFSGRQGPSRRTTGIVDSPFGQALQGCRKVARPAVRSRVSLSSDMHLLSAWLCVGAVVSQGLVALSASALAPESATGPAAILARAWPFYDFTSASVKPWHLKASYQLYDAEGRHPQEGVFEYWWASPDLSRSTWTRIGLKHTDWHMANGHLSYESEGSPISLFEYKLEAALIAPLPRARDLDPGASRLELKSENGDRTCLTILPADGTGAPAGEKRCRRAPLRKAPAWTAGNEKKGRIRPIALRLRGRYCGACIRSSECSPSSPRCGKRKDGSWRTGW